MGNNLRSDDGGSRPQSRAIVLRCSDEAYAEILRYIRDRSDTYIVYTKTSCLKLTVSEAGW